MSIILQFFKKRSSLKRIQFRQGTDRAGLEEGKDQQKQEAEIRVLCSKGHRGPSLPGMETAGRVTNANKLRYDRAIP